MSSDEHPVDAGANSAGNGDEISPPQHLAIIMDGNGRWANRQNRSRAEGHARGAEVLRDVTRWVRKRKISELTPIAEIALRLLDNFGCWLLDHLPK